MSTRGKKKTLSEEIAEMVTSATPKSLDPGAEGEEEALQLEPSEEFETVATGRSSMRAALTEPELDGKYGGASTSRAALSRWFEGYSEDEGEEGEEEGGAAAEDNEEQEEADDEEEEEEEESDEKGHVVMKATEEADKILKSLQQQEGGGEPQDKGDDEDEEGQGMTLISKRPMNAAEEDMKKAMHTKNQTLMWDVMVDLRIRMHKLMVSGNTMPKPEMHAAFCEHNDSVKAKFHEAQTGIDAVFEDLDAMECQLWNRDSGITSLAGKASPCPSLTATTPPSMEEVWKVLEKRGEKFQKYTGQVIDRWHERTQIGANSANTRKFKVVNQSAMKQIDQVLEDKQRLIKRTHLNRSGVKPIGDQMDVEGGDDAAAAKPASDDPAALDALVEKKKEEKLDEEMFDDTDFYGDLLRELIEQSNRQDQNGNDDLSVATAELSKLRKKQKKKKHDGQVSKGRKLKYDPHPKLVNFMAPLDTPQSSDWDTHQLFFNLFRNVSANQ